MTYSSTFNPVSDQYRYLHSRFCSIQVPSLPFLFITGTFTPVSVYDNNCIRVMMHFAKDHASPNRPDTLVAVISMMSTRTTAVQEILFQAAAPKVSSLLTVCQKFSLEIFNIHHLKEIVQKLECRVDGEQCKLMWFHQNFSQKF